MVDFVKANKGKRVFVSGTPTVVWHNINFPLRPEKASRYVLIVESIRLGDQIDKVAVEATGVLSVADRISKSREALLDHEHKTGISVTEVGVGFLGSWELLLRDDAELDFVKANKGKRIFVRGTPTLVWYNMHFPLQKPSRRVLIVEAIRLAEK